MTAIMIEGALRGLVLAMLVGAGLRLLRVTNVPIRKAAWTLVLIASMAMPFLMRWPVLTNLAARFAWAVPIHLAETARVPPASAAAPEIAVAGAKSAPLETAAAPDPPTGLTAATTTLPMIDPALNPAVAPDPAVPASTPGARAWQWPPRYRLITMIYFVVAGALLLRLLWGLAAACTIWARAEEVSPLVAPEPNVRVSKLIPSPVTIGSGVVLPADYTTWGRAKLRVVLAHERSHVRQMDFYLQSLAGLYTAFFWFSPLGWWLKRTLSSLGESISDRAAMDVAPSRSDYAGVLLEFAATPRRWLPGVAMARSGDLSRRVEGLLNENVFRRAFAEGRRRAMVSLLLIPAALFAVTTLVRVQPAAAQTEPALQNPSSPIPVLALTEFPAEKQIPPQQPVTGQSNPEETQVRTLNPQTVQTQAPPPSAPLEVAPQDAVPVPQPLSAPEAAPLPPPATPQAPKVAPQAPAPPDNWMTLNMPDVWVNIPKIPAMKLVMPKMPEVPLGSRMLTMMADGGWGNNLNLLEPNGGFYLTPSGGVHGYACYFSSNGDSWAIVDGSGKRFKMGEGATRDQLDLAQRMAHGPFLWFTHDGKSYMVDDPAIVSRVQSLYAPMKGLGSQQEALGIQQRVLGKMQMDMVRSQRDQARIRVPDLSKEMADAKAALDSLQSQQGQMLSEQKLAEMQSKLAEMQARLGSLQGQVAVQNKFAQRMDALGEQQRQLGEQQRQLGDQQKKLSRQAEQQVQSIIRECLQKGKATQLK